jgi:4-hydroxybenzoate polyprenyltransferase
MRPKQWTKNILFVLPGIVFDGKLTDPDSFFRVCIACILLILMSGSVYIINDLVDVESDRQHPRKKHRPIAAGQLSIPMARLAAILIPTSTLLFAVVFDAMLALVLLTYLILQVAYSFSLKHIVIIDVLTITAGFVLRVAAGVAVIKVDTFSPWLYVCAGLLALFLAIGKRRQELVTLGEGAISTRPIYREYNLPLLDDMLRIVTTSTLLTYIIYTIEADTRKFADVDLAVLTIPFVMYGLFRYLYLIHVKGEGSAPDEVLLKDRMLQVTMLLWGIVFLILIYIAS